MEDENVQVVIQPYVRHHNFISKFFLAELMSHDG